MSDEIFRVNIKDILILDDRVDTNITQSMRFACIKRKIRKHFPANFGFIFSHATDSVIFFGKKNKRPSGPFIFVQFSFTIYKAIVY